MKILHVINSLNIGGAEKLLTELLPEQRKKGHQISIMVLTSFNGAFLKSLQIEGVNTFINPCGKLYSFKTILFINRNISGFDVVHVHLFPSLYYLGLLKLIHPHLKLVYTEHSTNNKRRKYAFLYPIEKFIYKRYAYIFCISEETKNNLMSWLHISQMSKKRTSFIVLYNGIDLTKYAGYNITDLETTHIIMMVSRFSVQKDHETLVKAFAELLKTHQGIELYLVGDGETKVKIQTLVNNLGINSFVRFTGNRDDVPNLIAQSYVGVQSSHWEGFGLTAVEFMASRRPIVASDVAGLNSVVSNAGLLFRTGDVAELTAQLKRLLEDRDFYESIASQCYQRASEYSIQNTAEKSIEIYNSI